jgi:pimeloyl-ACP methyl ester carboxylesterase
MQSDVVGDSGVDELRRALPMLETFNVPKAGHMVAGDRNDAFNQAVIAFLYRHLPITAG